MRKNYVPREGSAVDRALKFLTEAGTPVGSAALATGIGVKVPDLAAHLKPGLKNGLLNKQYDDGNLFWSLGDGTPSDDATFVAADPDAEEQETPEPFSCGLYSDGDLALVNAGHDGDINCILSKAQTDTLVRYLLSFDRSDLTEKPSAGT
jgi:hypothetical protein